MKLLQSTVETTTTRLLLPLLFTACVQVEPRPDFEKARNLVEESTGASEVYDPYAPILSDADVTAIFADGLSLNEALRLAMVNNRDLQAEFQEIGIAHADWVQSRLLTNPSLDVLFRFPMDGGRSNLEAIVGGQLLELWRIPVRKKAARLNLESTILRIARRAGERLADTRKAYYAAVAAEELRRVGEANVALARLSFESVQSLHQAGAADAFDENLAQGPLLSAQLGLRMARVDAANAKRTLAKALSINRPIHDLTLTDPLPTKHAATNDPEVLVQRALESRLDLQAIKETILSLDARVHFERRKAWGDVGVGVAAERPPGSQDWLVGPTLSLTLPIFDQNQAQVARAGFKLKQMIMLYESASIAVAQDVRASADRVNTASRSLAFYEERLLPQAERSFALARESYAAGRSTLLALIEVQRQLLDARRGQVALRLEAAASSADLQRVVGAPG